MIRSFLLLMCLLLSPLSYAENIQCSLDANNDDEIQISEYASCPKYGDLYLCPLGRLTCDQAVSYNWSTIQWKPASGNSWCLSARSVLFVGMQVRFYVCNPSDPNQLWRYDPKSQQIVQKSSNKCLYFFDKVNFMTPADKDSAGAYNIETCDVNSPYQRFNFNKSSDPSRGSISQSNAKCVYLNGFSVLGYYFAGYMNCDPANVNQSFIFDTTQPPITYTCPAGNQFACVNNAGTYQCSPNQCVDLDNPQETIEEQIDDTPPDVPLENGECPGTYQIFKGRGLKCDKPGRSNAWKNCCVKTSAKISDDSAQSNPAEFIEILTNPVQYVASSIKEMIDCDSEDQETSVLNTSGFCHYIGEYCRHRIWGIGCVQKAKGFCCFASMLARIIHEQGRPQLNAFPADGGWGSAKRPNCRGFTPDEFQMLDFSKIDFSSYFESLTEDINTTMTPEMTDNVNQFMQGVK